MVGWGGVGWGGVLCGVGPLVSAQVLAVRRKRMRDHCTEDVEADVSKKKQAVKHTGLELHSAMQELFKIMPRFPEVRRDTKVTKTLRYSIPNEVLPIWCPHRTLHFFESCDAMPRISKHMVYMVTDGIESFVVKEYALRGRKDSLE